MDTPSALDNGIDTSYGILEHLDVEEKESKIEIPNHIMMKYAPLFTATNAEYFLTITFKPSCKLLINQFKPTAQLHESRGEILKVLKASCYFVGKPELTLAGRIHYHFMIRIKDHIKWHKSTIPYLNSLGRIDIQKIRNAENVTKYILKDLERYQDIFNKTCIIYHNKSNLRHSDNFISEEQANRHYVEYCLPAPGI